MSRSRKIPASPSGARVGDEVGPPDLAEDGRATRGGGGRRSPAARARARRRRRAPPRRGTRRAPHRGPAGGRRAPSGRSARPRRSDLGGELHGERPAAGHPGDLIDGRRGRRVEPADVGGADREVGRPSRRATSPAARRRAMRSTGGLRHASTRCRRGRQVQDERLEELVQRIAVGGVDVVDDERPCPRRRRGRRDRADRCGQGARLVRVVRRVGRGAGRQVVVDAGARAAELVDELTRQARTASSRPAGGSPRCSGRRRRSPAASPSCPNRGRRPRASAGGRGPGRPAPLSVRRPSGPRASARRLRHVRHDALRPRLHSRRVGQNDADARRPGTGRGADHAASCTSVCCHSSTPRAGR